MQTGLILGNLGELPMTAAGQGDRGTATYNFDQDQGLGPAEIAHGRAIGQAHLGTGTWTVPSPHHLSIPISTETNCC